MVCKKRGMYGFLGTSWVLITYIICPPCQIGRGVFPLIAKGAVVKTGVLQVNHNPSRGTVDHPRPTLPNTKRLANKKLSTDTDPIGRTHSGRIRHQT